MSRNTSIRLALSGVACAWLVCAQTKGAKTFNEATPPPGVVKGFMKAGKRCGALIAGGKMVYSNDVFTVTTRGHKVVWKVLEVSDKKARFARWPFDSANPLSARPDCTPNFGELAVLLEQRAQAYKSASTGALKDQVMTETHKCANSWCVSNQTLCIMGTLSDLTVIDDTTALLRLKEVDCGPFSAIRQPGLCISQPLQFTVPMTKEQALSFKAGYTAVLTGCPTFHSSASPLLGNDLLPKQSVASFSMLIDAQCIGSLSLADIKYDIFDPKAETVQKKISSTPQPLVTHVR